MDQDFLAKYGPWAVVAGASDGTGEAFAVELARRGLNVVLVARREAVLEELAERLEVHTRVVVLDLSLPRAGEELAAATEGLEVGLYIYNVGADTTCRRFLEQPIEDLQGLLTRNCATMMHGAHHFGKPMIERGHGGMLLVSSGAGWAGSSHIAVYGASKAFDTVLAEALWAEWHEHGVDVLGLVLGATDTPSTRRLLDQYGGDFGPMADPTAVAIEGLDHLADGPTWNVGMEDPSGPSPLGALPRRQAVELISAGTTAMYG